MTRPSNSGCNGSVRAVRWSSSGGNAGREWREWPARRLHSDQWVLQLEAEDELVDRWEAKRKKSFMDLRSALS